MSKVACLKGLRVILKAYVQGPKFIGPKSLNSVKLGNYKQLTFVKIIKNQAKFL